MQILIVACLFVAALGRDVPKEASLGGGLTVAEKKQAIDQAAQKADIAAELAMAEAKKEEAEEEDIEASVSQLISDVGGDAASIQHKSYVGPVQVTKKVQVDDQPKHVKGPTHVKLHNTRTGSRERLKKAMEANLKRKKEQKEHQRAAALKAEKVAKIVALEHEKAAKLAVLEHAKEEVKRKLAELEKQKSEEEERLRQAEKLQAERRHVKEEPQVATLDGFVHKAVVKKYGDHLPAKALEQAEAKMKQLVEARLKQKASVKVETKAAAAPKLDVVAMVKKAGKNLNKVFEKKLHEAPEVTAASAGPLVNLEAKNAEHQKASEAKEGDADKSQKVKEADQQDSKDGDKDAAKEEDQSDSNDSGSKSSDDSQQDASQDQTDSQSADASQEGESQENSAEDAKDDTQDSNGSSDHSGDSSEVSNTNKDGAEEETSKGENAEKGKEDEEGSKDEEAGQSESEEDSSKEESDGGDSTQDSSDASSESEEEESDAEVLLQRSKSKRQPAMFSTEDADLQPFLHPKPADPARVLAARSSHKEKSLQTRKHAIRKLDETSQALQRFNAKQQAANAVAPAPGPAGAPGPAPAPAAKIDPYQMCKDLCQFDTGMDGDPDMCIVDCRTYVDAGGDVNSLKEFVTDETYNEQGGEAMEKHFEDKTGKDIPDCKPSLDLDPNVDFNIVDFNSDGKLTREEMNMWGEKACVPNELAQQIFDAADADFNKEVTPEEYNAIGEDTGIESAIDKAADKSTEGEDQYEPVQLPAFRFVDANSDGQIDKDEMMEIFRKELKKRIPTMADSELEALASQHQQELLKDMDIMDKNGDGLMNEEEFNSRHSGGMGEELGEAAAADNNLPDPDDLSRDPKAAAPSPAGAVASPAPSAAFLSRAA